MRIEQIESFVAVCDLGSFTKASEKLHIGQPIVSRNISGLESELGCKLLKRTTRQIELTEEGETFLPYARTIVESMDGAHSDLKKLRERRDSKLTVGHSFLYMMSAFTMGIYNDFRKSLDHDVATSIVERSTEQIIDMVAKEQLDAAFAGITDFGLIPPEVSSIVLLVADEKILVAPEHRLADKPSINAYDLEGETLVYPSAAPSRASSLVQGDIEDLGIHVTTTFTAYEESALRIVEMGNGIIDVPVPYTTYQANVVEIPYECDRAITLLLIWHENNCSNTTKEFVRFVEKATQGWEK